MEEMGGALSYTQEVRNLDHIIIRNPCKVTTLEM
jgi:hypothetical protein